MIKIIVNIFYKPVEKLKALLEANSQIFTPINGGSQLKSDEWCVKHCFFDDDFKENISSHNRSLNEMTSIWWANKNLIRLSDPDYLGFNHYRRFFEVNEIERLIHEGFDMIISKPILCKYPLDWQYQYYHVSNDLAVCRYVMNEIKKDDGNRFMTYLHNHTNNFAPMNMFVMRKSLFCEWCDYIFPILFELEKLIDMSGRDNYQKRAVCFLCERIFGWWCYEKTKMYKVAETNVIEHLEFKDNNLNERGTY